MKLTSEERLRRCNYWYRVWYNAIPGLPEDMVTFDKIENLWNKEFPKLGLEDDDLITGRNDIENYLDEDTGLLNQSVRRRSLREFTIPYTKDEWDEGKENLYIYDIKTGRPTSILDTIEIRLCECVDVSGKVNALQFLETDVAIPRYWRSILGDYMTMLTKSSNHYRFKSIKKLLDTTELPQPPSERALPNPIAVNTKQARKFLENCPPYMSQYKKKLIYYTDEVHSF